MSDKERQLDEIEVLKSIYENELTVASMWPISGCLRISPVTNGDELNVNCITTVDQIAVSKTTKVKYLAPIELYFRCPKDYPSTSEPLFMLKCIWLPRHSSTFICHHLDALWDRHHSEILFEWGCFLKGDCVSLLNIKQLTFTSCVSRDAEQRQSWRPVDSRNLKFKELNNGLHVDEKIKNTQSTRRRKLSRKHRNFGEHSPCLPDYDRNYKYETPKDLEIRRSYLTGHSGKENVGSNLRSETDDLNAGGHNGGSDVIQEMTARPPQQTQPLNNKLDYILEMMPTYGVRRIVSNGDFDSRVISRGSTTNTLQELMDYNEECLHRELIAQFHYCGICFEEKAGSVSVCIKPCRHIFCGDCIREYLTINISTGSVRYLRCLDVSCSTIFSALQIHQNVDDETFNKYEKFAQKVAVEDDPNLLFCPREICQSIARRCTDLSPDIGYCARCCFYFCLYCKKAYHGIEICRLKDEERLKVVREYQKASAARQAELERRFSKRQIRKWVDDFLTEEWLQQRSKKCPNCAVSIEKNYGCNKMTCFNCNTQFCWLCDSCLNRYEPYHHFTDPKSTCYQKLFPSNVSEDDDDDHHREEGDIWFGLVHDGILFE